MSQDLLAATVSLKPKAELPSSAVIVSGAELRPPVYGSERVR